MYNVHKQLKIINQFKILERNQEAIVAILPPPTSLLPREKPVPVPKPPTKWEQYAKEKGIVKKKKTKLVWDDVVKEWIPRFGYKKAVAETEKNWVMEYKEGDDQDPREKMIEEKREKVAKNELQRLRNIARGKKTKVPGVGLAPMNPTESQTSDDIQKASHLAKKSTASLGKFQVCLDLKEVYFVRVCDAINSNGKPVYKFLFFYQNSRW